MDDKYIFDLEQYLTDSTEIEYNLLLEEAVQIAIVIINKKQLTV